jgi:phosphate transport system substrate-binding protein
MTHRKRGAAVLAALIVVVAAACSNSSSGGAGAGGGGKSLTGAGSTFAQPIYTNWASGFAKVVPGAQVNYQGVGSGGGIQDFSSKTVDFGASDVPLQTTDPQPQGSYIQFPTALGAVAIVYNVPGLKTGLKLDGATAANIFLGQIKAWNDPAIAALNPGVSLPSMPIAVVYRSDASGTSAIFTGWLSTESSTWNSQVGAGKSVSWPTGTGANGSSGVAAAVQQTQGAISYVSQDYALTSSITMASIKAPDGSYVMPSVKSISLAGGGLSFPITATTNILNSKVTGAYPIASTTYVLIYTDQTTQETAQTLVDYWYWGLTKGQAGLSNIGYAPLPSSVDRGSLGELAKITYNGQPVTPSASVKQ